MEVLRDHCPSTRLFETPMRELSELELLALVLTPGSTETRAMRVALRLLDRCSGLSGLTGLSLSELLACGLKREQAHALRASVELFARARQEKLSERASFRSSAEVSRHFVPLVRDLRRECFWSLLLDGKNRLLKLRRISEGSLTAAMAHPREVFRPAVLDAAAAVIFVHNHPSGDPEPSREDISLTRRLVETGRILGIRVLDHVIVAGETYFSFADQGMLER